MSDVLESNAAYLVLDASGTRVFCGIYNDGNWEACAQSDADSLEGIFACADNVGLRDRLRRQSLTGLVCCIGPGTILGVRLALMACAGWRSLPQLRATPLITYRSLHAAAAVLLTADAAPPGRFALISEFRNRRWNRLDVDAASPFGPIRLDDADSISTAPHPVFVLRQRHRASAPPENTQEIDCDLSTDARWLKQVPLEMWEHVPDPYLAQEPTFVKWTPGRHR